MDYEHHSIKIEKCRILLDNIFKDIESVEEHYRVYLVKLTTIVGLAENNLLNLNTINSFKDSYG